MAQADFASEEFHLELPGFDEAMVIGPELTLHQAALFEAVQARRRVYLTVM